VTEVAITDEQTILSSRPVLTLLDELQQLQMRLYSLLVHWRGQTVLDM
jgi:hypothetical protein